MARLNASPFPPRVARLRPRNAPPPSPSPTPSLGPAAVHGRTGVTVRPFGRVAVKLRRRRARQGRSPESAGAAAAASEPTAVAAELAHPPSAESPFLSPAGGLGGRTVLRGRTGDVRRPGRAGGAGTRLCARGGTSRSERRTQRPGRAGDPTGPGLGRRTARRGRAGVARAARTHGEESDPRCARRCGMESPRAISPNRWGARPLRPSESGDLRMSLTLERDSGEKALCLRGGGGCCIVHVCLGRGMYGGISWLRMQG